MHSETPRIRHQLADLLMSYGHKVVFYQKPLYFFNQSNGLANKQVSDDLEIRQTKQLLHHQLRLIRPLSYLNSKYERDSIQLSIGRINKNDVIINFNYDYCFLRDIFHNNKIVTVINDDFVAQAKFNSGKHVLNYLSKTLAISDMALTVSYPLYTQAEQYTKSVQMFLPWSKTNYEPPVQSNRNTLLLWAHIDNRIDFDLIEYLLESHPDFIFHFVGPISKNQSACVEKLRSNFINLKVIGPASLEDLTLEEYFAAIIPYRSNVADIEAVTASNKTFQLLSKGMPLITHGMPHFIDNPAIFKAKSYEGFSKYINNTFDDFYELQPAIEELVKCNQSEHRYEQIISIIN